MSAGIEAACEVAVKRLGTRREVTVREIISAFLKAEGHGVKFCTQHRSFQVNPPSRPGADDASCWAWEMLVSESPTPQQVILDCWLVPAWVITEPPRNTNYAGIEETDK